MRGRNHGERLWLWPFLAVAPAAGFRRAFPVNRCQPPSSLFLSQLGNEEQQERLLREWLDCCVTEGGALVAMQKSSRRRGHPLVTQMVDKWLDRYRQIRPCTSLSDGEEDEDDEDE